MSGYGMNVGFRPSTRPIRLVARILVQPTVLGMERQHGIDTTDRIVRVKTMWNFLVSIFIATIVAISSVACASTPCDGVNRSLSKERIVVLSPVIAKQLHVSTVDVLQSFRMDRWSIIYVETHESDEAFLFYADDP